MRKQVVPFLIYLIVLAATASKTHAGFVLPDTLIRSLFGDRGGCENDSMGPASDGSAPEISHQAFSYGFAYFMPEASAPESSGMGARSLEHSPVPQVPCLNDRTDPSAESIASLLCGYSIYGITPYVCRLFRPPRENALWSRYPCSLFRGRKGTCLRVFFAH